MPAPTILFLGANARDTTRLRLGAELRDIRCALQAIGAGDVFHLVAELALRPKDLQNLLLTNTPKVIHFSGHGLESEPSVSDLEPKATRDPVGSTSREFLSLNDAAPSVNERSNGGLLLEDERGAAVAIQPVVLIELLAIMARDTPLRCVVLNACFTASQAQAIAEHVDCVIGTTREIDDNDALAFSTAFYRALAHGKSVRTAFDLGRVEIGLRGPSGMDVVHLFHRSGILPEQVFLHQKSAPTPHRQPQKEQSKDALEFTTIRIDRHAPQWTIETVRSSTSPFSTPCVSHVTIDSAAPGMDLPLDITLLNVTRRPVMLSHVGVEIVEIAPVFEGLTPAEVARWISRRPPTARKVKKEDTLVIEGQKLFNVLRPHVVKVLRQKQQSDDSTGEDKPIHHDANARRSNVIPIGETVWSEFDDPIYLEAGAPYRFGVVVQDARDRLPSHLIVRITARSQMGESRSDPIELFMAHGSASQAPIK